VRKFVFIIKCKAFLNTSANLIQQSFDKSLFTLQPFDLTLMIHCSTNRVSIMSRALDHSATFPMHMSIYICTYLRCNLRYYIFVLDCGDQKFYNNRQDASLQLKTDSCNGMLQTLLHWHCYCTVYVYVFIHFYDDVWSFFSGSESVHIFFIAWLYMYCCWRSSCHEQ
jgi:hypothetical protein